MNIMPVVNALKQPFRKRRMADFLRTLKPGPEDKILDVGGSRFNWDLIDKKLNVVITNLTDRDKGMGTSTDNIKFVKGEGTALNYEDQSFDICFSNSVIEHVGPYEMQKLFAAEICRVGKKIWLQTPARSFFFDPHYLSPFVHWLPRKIQRKIARYFTVWGLLSKPSKESVNDFVDHIGLLGFRELKDLFPDCVIRRERFLFMTKAYLVIRK